MGSTGGWSRPNEGRRRYAVLACVLFSCLLCTSAGFKVHLSAEENRAGFLIFNSTLTPGRRYSIEASSIPLKQLSTLVRIDPRTGELFLKRQLSCSPESFKQPLKLYVSSKNNRLKATLVEYVNVPVIIYFKDLLCKSDEANKADGDVIEAVIDVTDDTVSSNFSAVQMCWRKSQEILSLTNILPMFQLRRCEITYIQPKDDIYLIENNGDHIVASRDLCKSAPLWTWEFQFRVTCDDETSVETTRLHFQKEKDKSFTSTVTRERLRRATFNQSPYFDQTLYKAVVPEEVESGYSVIALTATDPDGDKVQYTLQAALDSRSQRLFTINSYSGEIKTNTHLDREFMDVHFLRVTAVDDRTPHRSGTTTVQVVVTDRNDHTPVFEQATYVTSVRESSLIGSTVATIRATDQDVGENAELEYSILNPLDENSVFHMDPYTGIITLSDKLDRENTELYSLLIQAVDMGQDPERRSSIATVEITVLDDNDNYPQFTERTYLIDVPEDIEWESKPVIAVVKALDKDQGINSMIRYAIIGGNTQGHFGIDSQSGEVYVISPLDYETARSYRLIVRAQDGGQPSRSNTTNVILRVLDANDNDPKFYTSLFQESVSEGAPVGHSIVRVQAYDADDGPNAEIGYSLTARTDPVPFTVDPMSGWIISTNKLDRESNPFYDFVVMAKDRGSPSRSSTASVVIRVQDINDNDPVFDPKIYEASVSEIDPPGTPVVGVTATDRDEEPRLIYQIINGNTRGRFNIIHQNKEGLISVAQPLDYKTDKKFVLTITVTDAGGRSDMATVHINVTDANTHRPTFEKLPYSASVSEEAPVGTTVLVVEASDADVGENAHISYYMEENPEFTIDSTTGAIVTKHKLDREFSSGYVLVVTAQDHGIPSLSDTINVEIDVSDVNDNPPNFILQSYSASIREDALIGSSVMQVSASDKDIGLSGQVRYTFSGGEDGDGAFVVEPTSGIIRTNQLLDRESLPMYRLIVHAVDRGITPLSSSATIVITVEDVNDNPPRFDSDTIKMFVSENSPIGSTVGEILATDQDEGSHAEIFYSIAGGPDADKFSLVSRNGMPAELLTKTDLDYETSKKKYIIIVRASSPPLRNDVEVDIWVTDVNDNAPRLRDFYIFFNHHTKHFPNHPIGNVPAYDADVTDKLRYKFLSGNNANLLILNEKSGELSLSPNLNTNVPLHAVMEISVFDGINEVSAECHLIVQHVTDAMLFNSATLRLQRLSAIAFLSSPVLDDFVEGLAAIIPCPKENIFIFSIQEDNASEERILNVSFSARPGDARDLDIFFTSQYLQERVYLGRALLAKITHVHVLPFENNLCVREPCSNFEQCLSALKFGSASDFVASDQYFFRSIIPANTFACRCPPGFTGMNHKYECNTEVNLCYSSPCLEGGTCIRREGGFSCVCKEGFTGQRCEVNLLNDSCVAGLCHGNSKCASDEQGLTCRNCPEEDWSTSMCELRARTFEKGSYLTFPALRQRYRLSLKLRFATQDRHALLLYNGRYNDEHDFIALEITNSQLAFSFSLGGAAAAVTAYVSTGVSDGQWHTANVAFFNRTATLSVDNCDTGLSLKYGRKLENYMCANSTAITLEPRCSNFMQSCYRFLDLTGPLQIGGLPALPSDFQIKNNHFSGCIMDFHVDNQLVDFNSYVANNGTKLGCPQKLGFCHSGPCKNGATCIDGWRSYNCICPSGFIGKDCSEGLEPGKHFLGDGFLVFIPHLHPIQLPWVQRVSFRTHHDHGLLIQIKLGHNSFIAIDIVEGYIRYIFNNQQLLLPDATVNDGKWHTIEATWFPNGILLSLDYGQHEMKKLMKASIRGMYIGKVSIGGVEIADDESQAEFFIGCIQDVKIGNSQGSWLKPMVEVNVHDGCFSPDLCSSNPCPQNSKCVELWGNYSCVCDSGYVGKQCLPVCSLNPCSENSTCIAMEPPHQDDSRTYHCKCDAEHTGIYCETMLDHACPANWWGYPICGPCHCDVNKGYSPDCNKTTGECSCEDNHFQPSKSAVCYSCNCYAVGSYGNGCDSVTGQCHCRPGVIGRRCESCSNPFAEVTLRGCEVVYDSCPQSYSNEIWWPRTLFDESAEQDCPSGSFGTAVRFCSEGTGWSAPDLFSCTSHSFRELSDQLENIDKIELNTSVVVNLAAELNVATNKTFPLHGNDIVVFSMLLHHIIEHEKQKAGLDLSHRQDRNFIKNLVKATSSVLNPVYAENWNRIVATSGKGVETLIQNFESYMHTLLNHLIDTFTRPFELTEKNLVFGVDTVSSADLWTLIPPEKHKETLSRFESSPYLDFSISETDNKPGITFPKFNNFPVRNKPSHHFAEAIIPLDVIGIQELKEASETDSTHTNSMKQVAVVGYIIYSTVGQLLSSRFDDSIKYHGIPLEVNSPVLTLIVKPINSSSVHSQKLSQNIRLHFKLSTLSNMSPQCAFWSFDDGRGYWSNEGCKVEHYSAESYDINCSCSHLSTFAVLTEKNRSEFVPTESTTQNVISYLAITISLTLLAITFLIFCLLRGSQTNSNAIHICLVASIFSAELIFLIALKSRHTLVFQQFPCKMIAILLHFLFLSIFSWLLVEAIHIFRMMTNLCDINHGPMHCYFFVGFGGPALIVGLSVGISVDQYGNHFFCWLSVHENVVWSLVGPVCVVVIVTLAVFIAAFKTSFQSKDAIMDFGNLKTLLWLAVMLLPVQGATWVLAILSVNETHTILQYAFSFFCLLEGVYIFVGYCVINKKVQQQMYCMWLKFCRKKQYPENLNGVKSSKHIASGYHQSSKVYHRSIGISTSSATSRSTARTCASHNKAGSETMLSDNRNHVCGDSRDDMLIGNHFTSPPVDEDNEENACGNMKMSEGVESVSPGPKMGINIFSYPRHHSSVSSLNRPTLSLKVGLNTKDQLSGWAKNSPADSQTSSPLSAPVYGARPEFSAPRMGISRVEKSMHSPRDHLSGSNSPSSSSYVGNACMRPDFRTGICSACRSNSSSKEIVSNCSSAEFPQYDPYLKSLKDKSGSFDKSKHPYSSKEHLFNHGAKMSHSGSSQKKHERLKIVPDKIPMRSVSQERLNAMLKTLSSSELENDAAATSSLTLEPVSKSALSKDSLQESLTQSEISGVCTQSTPGTGSYLDRASPRLIDDTPSEEDLPLSISASNQDYGQTTVYSSSGSYNSNTTAHLLCKQDMIIPPLATAELSDTDFDEAMETAV